MEEAVQLPEIVRRHGIVGSCKPIVVARIRSSRRIVSGLADAFARFVLAAAPFIVVALTVALALATTVTLAISAALAAVTATIATAVTTAMTRVMSMSAAIAIAISGECQMAERQRRD